VSSSIVIGFEALQGTDGEIFNNSCENPSREKNFVFDVKVTGNADEEFISYTLFFLLYEKIRKLTPFLFSSELIAFATAGNDANSLQDRIIETAGILSP
jgi:hypothetical protein